MVSVYSVYLLLVCHFAFWVGDLLNVIYLPLWGFERYILKMIEAVERVLALDKRLCILINIFALGL